MSAYKNRKPKNCIEKDVKIIAGSQCSLSSLNPDDSNFMVSLYIYVYIYVFKYISYLL